MTAQPPLWATLYPSVADVQLAHVQTLAQWDEHLPPPQTDVERTVRRRVALRYEELCRVALRQEAPQIADQLNDIIHRLDELGVKHGVKPF
jgi:hypothetical protein